MKVSFIHALLSAYTKVDYCNFLSIESALKVVLDIRKVFAMPECAQARGNGGRVRLPMESIKNGSFGEGLKLFAETFPKWDGVLTFVSEHSEVVVTKKEDTDAYTGSDAGGGGEGVDEGVDEGDSSQPSQEGEEYAAEGAPEHEQGEGEGDTTEGSTEGDTEGESEEGKEEGEGQGEGEQPKPEQPQPEPQPEPEPEEPKPTKKKVRLDKTCKVIKARLEAGLVNLWLHGPAGCGKTTMCSIVAEAMGLPCYVLSCSKDTDPSQVQGRRYPTPEESEFIHFYERPSIIVLDEFTAVEADTAMLLNAALANGKFTSSTKRTVVRHPRCYVVATSNTLGLGGDATYCGNQRLDASTRDRFSCGFIQVDYSHAYERALCKDDKDVHDFIKALRKVVVKNDLEQIVSTRTLIGALALKRAGCTNWKSAAVGTWNNQELGLIKPLLDGDIIPDEDDKSSSEDDDVVDFADAN
jgi:hypothetical protein